jgi:hypothetical protein
VDTNYVSLERSQEASDLYKSHKEVVAYWTPIHDLMESCFRHLRGKHWTDDELKQFVKKNKTALVFNQLKPAERTILGLFIQNKYDVKFSPRESNSQDISDVLQKLYAFTAYSQDWSFKDIEMVRQAWAGGVSYMEMYVQVVPGQKPKLCSQVLNPFSLFWDPESRHLITRDDAEFVDRDTWVAFPYLQEKWPEHFHEEGQMAGGMGQTSFQATNVYADRSAQYYDAKNNRYKLTERYYKVRKKVWFAMDPDWKRLDIQNPTGAVLAKYRAEGYQVFSETREFMNLAIICPAWNTSRYLYNAEYHCQPRDLVTGKIIWPFLELIAESLNGEPSGFVEHLIPANRLINSSVSNIFHANKHAASTGLIRKKKLFGADEVAARRFDKNHVDADAVHVAADTADLTADLSVIPSKTVSGDTNATYDIGGTEFQRLSSTPPSLQGIQEESGTSGVLNSQRIEQSFVQLQPLIANIKYFLRRRAELAYYYWREYWTYPMEFRIVNGNPQASGGIQAQKPGQEPGNPSDPQAAPPRQAASPKGHQFMTLNQEVPVQDGQGRPTGALQKINDVTTAEMDVDIEDSYQSPTYRAKVQQQLSDLMNKAGNVDPTLLEALFGEYAKATDMSQDTKDIVSQSIQSRQEAANQPPAPPPPEAPRMSFSFKGEDLSNPAVLELMRATGMLPPEVIDSLEVHAQPPSNQEPPDPSAPLKAEKHASDMKMAQAKLEGQQLTNAKSMQDIADKEADVNGGLVPSVAKTVRRHPTAFSPMGAR